MLQPEQIITIKQFHESTLKEKGSEFIALVFPVEQAIDCENTLNTIKKKYYDATHHCYAYRLLEEVQKFSDDGEPSGSAGMRILNAIDHFNLTNLIVFVIRYFGGTKLGIGPLGKAYYTAAFEVLDKSDKISKHLLESYLIKTESALISNVYRIVSMYNGKVEKTSFEDKLVSNILIPPKNAEFIKRELNELSGGNSELISTNRKFYI